MKEWRCLEDSQECQIVVAMSRYSSETWQNRQNLMILLAGALAGLALQILWAIKNRSLSRACPQFSVKTDHRQHRPDVEE